MRIKLGFEGTTYLDCANSLRRVPAAGPGVRKAEIGYATRRGTVTADQTAGGEDLLRNSERTGCRAEIATEEETSPGSLESGRAPSAKGRSYDFDLLVVGSGAAGMAAGIRASELGATAAVVEGGEVVGGTCVNIGCIPSKFLIEAAHHYHAARTGFPGVAACELRLAWREILARKREIVGTLRRQKYLDVLDAYAGVTLLQGRARLLGGGQIRIGEREVSARKIVLATGASPALPLIPGIAEAGALDSTSLMELEDLPASLIVVGGGSIGLELGQALARFGVRVIVLEAQQRILPGEDPEISAALLEALVAEGIEVRTGVSVTRVVRDAAEVVVRVETASRTDELRAERLLVATGRTPNSRELGLEDAGVEVDGRGFVQVDEFMRTTNPDVFAAGDVTAGPGYVYVAAYEGGIAAHAALAEIYSQEPIPADLSVVPRVTFTDPQVAAVGRTVEEARAAGLRTKATSLPVEHLARAAVSRRHRGVIKLVANADSDRLLGAHLVAAHAGDVIGEAGLAVRFGLRAQELVSTMHPYLTWGEGLKLAGQTFTREVAKLSCCA